MKKIAILLLIALHVSCDQKNKKQALLKEMNEMAIAPKEKQLTYAIHINAKTPYEIFLDDIPVERDSESGMNSTIELNQYLLQNGDHELKVIYLPRPDAEDGLLDPTHVYNSKDSKWNIYFVNFLKNPDEALGYEGEIDYENNELEVLPPPKPVPFWEQTFNLEVKDLPYELEGWKNGQDLSKIDERELKKEVFQYFNKIRDLLDKGKIDEYIALNKKKYLEMAVCLYTEDVSSYWSESKKNKLSSYCTGNMWPIKEEDYALKLYANGKLASLERITTFKNQGLIAETETDYWYYNFLLFKPIGKEDFEIIRK